MRGLHSYGSSPRFCMSFFYFFAFPLVCYEAHPHWFIFLGMMLQIGMLSTIIFIGGRQFLARELYHWDKCGYFHPSLMQKIKERNKQPPKRPLVGHKRGQKIRNSWEAIEDQGLCFRVKLKKMQPCQTTSTETTREGKEDGGRVYPCDAVREASCSTRGSQQQMDVFKWTWWAANGKVT